MTTQPQCTRELTSGGKMKTQSDVAARYEQEIPQDLRERFAHLDYQGMSEHPDCAKYADLLRELNDAWFDAEDAR